MEKEIKFKSTLELYKQLKVNRTNALSPRRGYYLIQEVNTDMEPSVGCNIQVATALWKLEGHEVFNMKNLVKVQLQTLARNPFPGSNEQLSNVIGNIIHIRSLHVDSSNPDLPKVVCKWGVIKHDEEFDVPEVTNHDQEIQAQLDQIDQSNMEIQNAVLDHLEYMEEWDNYESNLILDIEEHQIKIEQEAANRLSNPSAL